MNSSRLNDSTVPLPPSSRNASPVPPAINTNTMQSPIRKDSNSSSNMTPIVGGTEILHPFPFHHQIHHTVPSSIVHTPISSPAMLHHHPPFPSPISMIPGGSPIHQTVTLTPASLVATNLAAVASLALSGLTAGELVFKARLAMQAERYEEMAYFTRVLVLQKSTILTSEERSLFALAYKKLLGTRRMGWRYIYSIEMKDKAAARKIEAEIQRETEKEAREKEQAAAAAKVKAEEKCDSDTAATTTDDSKSTKAQPPPTAAPAPATTVSPIPALQARLATLTSNLHHLHSYRYQLFYESSLLISEVSSLLLERLLPKLLTQHTQSEDVFTRWIPAIIEQLIQWERKRTGTGRNKGIGVTTANTVQSSTTAASSSKDKPSAANPLEPGLTPLLTALPISSTAIPTATPTLTKLDTSRQWSLEAEFELQLRALDERTRFLSSLKSSNAESLVFYCKLFADHRRLLAEFLAERDYEETERVNQSLQALSWYVLARFIAQPTLSPSHPVRLGLHLNFAVFYYEVLAKPDRASQMASQTYDLALNEWQNRQAIAQGASSTSTTGPNTSGSTAPNSTGATQNDPAAAASAAAAVAGTYKDSLLIMQLLKNNLTIWAQSI